MPDPSHQSSDAPLFVDLDRSLIATDLLAESLIQVVRQSPLHLAKVLPWLLEGRASLKRQLALHSEIDVATLPYHEEVVRFLQAEKERGRQIFLATASDEHFARSVAEHLDVFDEVLASDGQTNVKGQRKRAAIEQYCRDHNLQAFAYLGDSRSDLAVWEAAEEIYMVSPGRLVRAAAKEFGKPTRVFEAKGSKLNAAVRALRPQQWVKNLLVFVPLIVGHQAANMTKAVPTLLSFVAFCLFASCVYVINDLFDLEADRRHDRKKERPFASGTLPVTWGPPLVLMLLLVGVFISAAWLPLDFLVVAGIYFGLNLLYSFWLKSKVVIDVVLLSIMYTLRVLAGGAASDIPPSEWLLAFAMFIFTSLAFAKRYSELLKLEDGESEKGAKGRGYLLCDLRLIGSLGTASGLIAVLVVVLYVNSEQVRILYSNERLLLLLCPLMLYWVSRLWMIAGRGELREDPVAYTIFDWRSWVLAVLAVAVLWFAK